MTTNNNDAPVASYIVRMGEIADIATRLQEYAADHGGIGPDDVTWGSVADLTEVVARLRGAAAWAGIDLEAEEAGNIAEWNEMMLTEYAGEGDEDPALLKL